MKNCTMHEILRSTFLLTIYILCYGMRLEAKIVHLLASDCILHQYECCQSPQSLKKLHYNHEKYTSVANRKDCCRKNFLSNSGNYYSLYNKDKLTLFLMATNAILKSVVSTNYLAYKSLHMNSQYSFFATAVKHYYQIPSLQLACSLGVLQTRSSELQKDSNCTDVPLDSCILSNIWKNSWKFIYKNISLTCKNGELSLFGNICIGAISRTISAALAHPLNAVKLVDQGILKLNEDQSFNYSLLRPHIFLRGLLPQVCLSIPAGAINLSVLMWIKQRLQRSPIAVHSALCDAISQATATIAASVISTPQTLIVDRITTGFYSSMYDAMRITWKEEGICGFYRGYIAGLLSKLPGYSLTWLVYRKFRDLHSKLVGSQEFTLLEDLYIGSVASLIVAFTLYPLDTIKSTIISLQSKESMKSIITNIIKEGGWLSLYKGVRIKMLSVLLLMGTQLAAYEFLKKLFVSHNFPPKKGEVMCIQK